MELPLELPTELPELEPDGELDAPRAVREMTAKSIFPVVGLRITSSMRPIFDPEDSLTSAPISLLPRTACELLLTPVALNCRLLQLLVSLLELPEEPRLELLPDESMLEPEDPDDPDDEPD